MDLSPTRLFIASSELFSDFEVRISLYNISTLKTILNVFYLTLEFKKEDLF